jgi:hypothetical protein
VAMRKIMKESIDKYIHKVEEKYKYLYPVIKNRYCNNANTTTISTTIGTTISTFLPFVIFGLNFYQLSKGIFNL